MIIYEPDPKVRKVKDVTIHLVTGHSENITLDDEAGDRYEWNEFKDALVITQVPKKTPDGESLTKPIIHTFFKAHIAMIQTQEREFTELTSEQRRQLVEWSKTRQEVTLQ